MLAKIGISIFANTMCPGYSCPQKVTGNTWLIVFRICWTFWTTDVLLHNPSVFLHMKWLLIRLPELSMTLPRKTSPLVLSLVDNLFIKLARWWASQPQVQTTSGRSTWPQVLPETCLALAILGVLQTMPNASLSEPPWKSTDCCFRRLPTQLTRKSVMQLFKMFWLVQDTTEE